MRNQAGLANSLAESLIRGFVEWLIREVAKHPDLHVREQQPQKTKPAPIPRHVTVDEYANHWSVGRSSVRRWIRERKLPCTRHGRSVRVLLTDKPTRRPARKRRRGR